MGKKKKQTTKQQLDPGTQRFVEDFLRPTGRRAANDVMNAGPLTAGPTDLFRAGAGGLANAGQGLQEFREGLGDFTPGEIRDPLVDEEGNRISAPTARAGRVGAFGFTPEDFDFDSIQNFLNPFMDEVVGAQQQTFDRQRQRALDMAAQEATQAGAFGGSRSGILQAEALGGVNRNEAQSLANLRRAGFSEAVGNALGLFGTEQNLGLQTALGAQEGRIAQAQMDTQAAMQNAQLAQQNRGLGLRADIARAGLGLDAFRTAGQLGLGALGQQAGVAGDMARLGEVERQALTERMRDPILRGQAATGIAAGSVGPHGMTTTQTKSPGGLFGTGIGLPQLAGAGMMAFGPGGLLASGAANAASGGGSGGGFGK